MGNTATDNKSEEVVDKAPAKTEAKAAEKKTEEKKPATTAAKKTEEKKSEEKKVEDKKTEDKKVEDKPTATEGAESKPEEKPEAKPEAQLEAEHKKEDAPVASEVLNEDDTKHEYPYDIILKKSISTYRGPSIELLNKPFGGKLTVLGITGNFYKVQFVRAGFGTVVAYVLCEEVHRWAS